mmetsp:Transcript_25821/g.44095  ORF Transcript_25821/g.44095 Transcript_25821/m.44095 type:complete len:403 (-) Transcript_25821:109-1317(-)
MVPPPSKTVRTNASNLKRCSTDGSDKSDGSIMSIDLNGGLPDFPSCDFGCDNFSSSELFRSFLQDAPLDGGLEAICESLQGSKLPDPAATAANARKGEQPRTRSASESKVKATSQDEKIGKLEAKLEQKVSSNCNKLAPLKMSFRISSGSLIKDCKAESANLVASNPSLFSGNQPSSVDDAMLTPSQLPLLPPTLPPPTFPSSGACEEYEVPLRCSPPSKKKNIGKLEARMERSITGETLLNEPSRGSSIDWIKDKAELANLKNFQPGEFVKFMYKNANKQKKDRTRKFSETPVSPPIAGDVLSGRGPGINSWPGNKRFRDKALELSPRYNALPKEEKHVVAEELVAFIKNEGNRFLRQGHGGFWYEMVGTGSLGPRSKASAAFRDVQRGPKKKKAKKPGAK